MKEFSIGGAEVYCCLCKFIKFLYILQVYMDKHFVMLDGCENLYYCEDYPSSGAESEQV